MKKAILFLSIVLILSGCDGLTQNDESCSGTRKFYPSPSLENATTKQEKLVGSWEWIKTVKTWGAPPTESTPESTDSSCYYTFTFDYVFKRYPKGCLSDEGMFSFDFIGLPADSIIGVRVEYYHFGRIFMYFFREGDPDTLLLSLAYVDGPMYYFVRKKRIW